MVHARSLANNSRVEQESILALYAVTSVELEGNINTLAGMTTEHVTFRIVNERSKINSENGDGSQPSMN